jgi:hypothetical protein
MKSLSSDVTDDPSISNVTCMANVVVIMVHQDDSDISALESIKI